MKKLLPVFLVLLSNYSFGQDVNLTCVDKKSGYTMNLSFDENNQTVKISNKTLKAKINTNEIIFKEIGLDNRVYLQKLNRSTGTLQIFEMSDTSSNSVIDSTYDCSITKKKF
jgi:hypothetical protein